MTKNELLLTMLTLAGHTNFHRLSRKVEVEVQPQYVLLSKGWADIERAQKEAEGWDRPQCGWCSYRVVTM
jgi:hypothetical protein